MFTAILVVHIVCGFAALGAGTAISFLQKGTRTHKKLGRFFFYAMIGIAISAIILAVYKSSTFLLFIALFSLFQSLGGRRVINNASEKIGTADHLILLLGVATSIIMILSFNGLLVFFGVLSLGACSGLARYCFSSDPEQRSHLARLRLHISLMGGSFIATITAFVVVNVPQGVYETIPAWLPWILPTLVFVPIMTGWIRKYTKPGDKEAVSGGG